MKQKPAWNKYSINPYSYSNNLEALIYRQKEIQKRKVNNPKEKQKKQQLVERRNEYGKYVNKYYLPKHESSMDHQPSPSMHENQRMGPFNQGLGKDIPYEEDDIDFFEQVDEYRQSSFRDVPVQRSAPSESEPKHERGASSHAQPGEPTSGPKSKAFKINRVTTVNSSQQRGNQWHCRRRLSSRQRQPN